MAERDFRCGGAIGPDTTREDLLSRGFTPGAADEALAFRDRLARTSRRVQRYRRKPVYVEAVRYTETDAAMIESRDADTFFGHRAHEVTDEEGCVYRTGKLWVEDPEIGRTQLCPPGHWIVTDWQGLHLVMAPEQFEADYEPAPTSTEEG